MTNITGTNFAPGTRGLERTFTQIASAVAGSAAVGTIIYAVEANKHVAKPQLRQQRLLP